MPANKNAVTRYKYIDELLSDKHHYYDIHDITSKVNDWLEDAGFKTVTQRMIEKDIDYLQYAPFDADIERYRESGKACIRYADPTFSIFTKKLSDDEQNLLSEVLNTIGQFDGLDNFDWLDAMKNKLGLSERQKIISFSKNLYLKNSNLLGGLFSAISNKQVVEIVYKKFSNSESQILVLHPYLLKEYNNRWFLIGSLDKEKMILNLPLDRIENYKVLPTLKYKDYKGDIEERFEDIIGVTVFANKKVENILLWVSDKDFPYLDTKPLHGSQTVVSVDNETKYRKKYSSLKGGRFIKLQCKENYELIVNLVSYLDALVVLEPKALREKVGDIVGKMNGKYLRLRK
jgi:predicted DNA-binding transcriptional regulator YafY